MSYELTAWAMAVERPAEAGADWSTAKFVLAAMASFADARGQVCFASVATLAQRIDKSPSTVKRGITVLKRFGLIVPAEHQIPGRRTRFRFGFDGASPSGPRSQMTQVIGDLPHAGPRPHVTQGVGHQRPRTQVTDDPQTRSLTSDLTGDVRESRTERPRLALVTAPPSVTCQRHPDGTDEPCAACGDARRRRQESEKQRRLAALEDDLAHRRDTVAAEREAIEVCCLCDGRGYRGTRPCDHDPDRDDRNARGIARVRAVLDRRTVS